MIKVLIVEDDPVAAQFIEYILGTDPDVKVVGTAGTAGKALMMMDDLKPNVVTMDLDLPGGVRKSARRSLRARASPPAGSPASRHFNSQYPVQLISKPR